MLERLLLLHSCYVLLLWMLLLLLQVPGLPKTRAMAQQQEFCCLARLMAQACHHLLLLTPSSPGCTNWRWAGLLLPL